MIVVVSAIVDPWVTTLSFVVALAMRIQDQNNLVDFKAGKGMTVKTKTRILVTVTLIMAVGLIAMLMKGVIVGSIVLVIVWLGHIYYFGFKVKTIEE